MKNSARPWDIVNYNNLSLVEAFELSEKINSYSIGQAVHRALWKDAL